MSGRGIVEAEIWRTQQIEAEERTSDPPNPAVGDWWVRIDIKPSIDNTNVTTLGALRIQGSGGVLQVPLINSDDSPYLGEDVYIGPQFFFGTYANNELFGSSVGFVPVTDQGGAKGSPRVATPAGVEFEAHDDVELSAIPDSGILRYDMENANNDKSVLEDQFNTNSGTNNGASYLSSGGPNSDGAYDLSSNDYITCDYTPTISDPISYAIYLNADSWTSGDIDAIVSPDNGGFDYSIVTESSSKDIGIYHADSSTFTSKSPTNQWIWLIATFDPDNNESKLYFDKTEEISTTCGTDSTTNKIHIGGLGGSNKSSNNDFTVADFQVYGQALSQDDVDTIVDGI